MIEDVAKPYSFQSKGLLMMADDDVGLRNLYVMACKASGYTIETASDGVEIVGMIERLTPHILILDINMPRMNGIEACKQARRIMGPDTPIVFLTSEDTLAIIREAVAAGGDDFLIKSEAIETIIGRLDYWADRRFRANLDRRRIALSKTLDHEAEQDSAPSFNPAGLVALVVSRLPPQATELGGFDENAKLERLGFVAGMLDAALDPHPDRKALFQADLDAVLDQAGLAVDVDIQTSLADWVGTTKNSWYRQGHETGRRTWAKDKTNSGETVPWFQTKAVEVAGT